MAMQMWFDVSNEQWSQRWKVKNHWHTLNAFNSFDFLFLIGEWIVLNIIEKNIRRKCLNWRSFIELNQLCSEYLVMLDLSYWCLLLFQCNDVESHNSHSPTLNQLHVQNRTHSMKLRVLGLCMFVCIVHVMISSCIKLSQHSVYHDVFLMARGRCYIHCEQVMKMFLLVTSTSPTSRLFLEQNSKMKEGCRGSV